MSLSELSHVEVKEIMQGNRSAVLLHANKCYLLSITRRGKLILTAAENLTDPVRVPSGDTELVS